MKNLAKGTHFLRILKQCKCKKTQKTLFRHCDEQTIQMLSELVYNLMKGNLRIDTKTQSQLKKYKTSLRAIYKCIIRNRCLKRRRKIIVNQVGGFWPPLAGLALQALASLGGEKLLEYGINKVKSLVE